MNYEKRNIPFTLVATLIFVVLFGLLFPKNPEKYLRSQLFLKKTFAPAVYNLVISGDSRIYRGVVPEIIEKEIEGWRVINLGYSNGGLNPAMFRLAESKLNKSGGTRAILIGITAFTLTPESLENKHYLENKAIKREERIEQMHLGKLLNWFSPMSPEKVRNLFSKPDEPVQYINKYCDEGWVASEKFPADTLEAFESYRQSFLTQKVTPAILDGLIQQISEWEKSGIQVFAFRPPVPEAMLVLADTLAGYDQALISRRVTEAGGTWIDIDPTRYKTYDGSHLNPQSAKALSADLAKIIKKVIQN